MTTAAEQIHAPALDNILAGTAPLDIVQRSATETRLLQDPGDAAVAAQNPLNTAHKYPRRK